MVRQQFLILCIAGSTPVIPWKAGKKEKEKWLSGLKRELAKLLRQQFDAAGSNPVFSGRECLVFNYFSNPNMSTQTPCTRQRIAIKFESYKPIVPTGLKRQTAINLARKYRLRAQGFSRLLSTGKRFITVISGPHVHKKSREQYKMDCYRGLFVVFLDDNEYSRFMQYKRELLNLEGVDLTFTYFKKDIVFSDLF